MDKQEANLELIRQAYADFGRGDIAAVLQRFAPDALWQHAGDPALVAIAGDYRGRDGIARFFQRVVESYDILEFVPQRLQAFEDQVLVHGRERMRFANGREVVLRWLHLFTITNGSITAGEEWTDGAAMLAAQRGL